MIAFAALLIIIGLAATIRALKVADTGSVRYAQPAAAVYCLMVLVGGFLLDASI